VEREEGEWDRGREGERERGREGEREERERGRVKRGGEGEREREKFIDNQIDDRGSASTTPLVGGGRREGGKGESREKCWKRNKNFLSQNKYITRGNSKRGR